MSNAEDFEKAESSSGISPRNVVRLEGLSKLYRLGNQSVLALDRITLSVDQSAFLAIAGPSGSGKSTLLNIMGCIDVPSSGSVYLNGQRIGSQTPDALADIRARRIGFVFQTFNLLPVLTAAENVEYPLFQLSEVSKRERRERVAELLELVGLAAYAGHRPNQLSGGQRQRVAVARALVNEPNLVLADEPTANLDHRTGESIIALMKEINQRRGTTFIFSTHDDRIIAAADRLVRIEDGRIISPSGSTAD